ncbi:hypothetical protein RLV_4964 [Rhizobium leguminosarum bv. viciae]|nr:hypothetical protein RLV_4964 [Rhizobium leguminosarum bv. viciae]
MRGCGTHHCHAAGNCQCGCRAFQNERHISSSPGVMLFLSRAQGPSSNPAKLKQRRASLIRNRPAPPAPADSILCDGDPAWRRPAVHTKL